MRQSNIVVGPRHFAGSNEAVSIMLWRQASSNTVEYVMSLKTTCVQETALSDLQKQIFPYNSTVLRDHLSLDTTFFQFLSTFNCVCEYEQEKTAISPLSPRCICDSVWISC